MKNRLRILIALLCACACARAGPLAAQESPAPEAATGYTQKTSAYARHSMISAADVRAVDAGNRILRAGGSAVDAAIAVQMVLNLVEPQSSGIGGGALLLLSEGGKVVAYDGRETAPMSARPELFLDAQGKPLSYYAAVVGGRATGVPGVLRMLQLAHREHGKLPWASLFEPAIALAEQGFAVSPRLNALLKFDVQQLRKDAVAAAYFYAPDGTPWPVGHVLKNPPLAKTLRAIAHGGPDVFYKGPLAREIVAKVRSHPSNPGTLALKDLAAYRALKSIPVCSDYRRWTVCGAPPPSSGGIAIAQMLGILETRKLAALAPLEGRMNIEAIHLFSEAGRLAFADRARYVADTDFVALPGGSPAALLDKGYLAQRAALIGERSMDLAPAGKPEAALAMGRDRAPEFESTSHFSIADREGRVLSYTSTVESAFGSRQMVAGFLLNNQLTDFSAVPQDEDGPVANRVEGGKRPRSSMAPTLVFEKGGSQPVLAIGSPGGSSIINYVAKTLVAMLDWKMGLQEAIELPHIGSRNGPTELERGRFGEPAIEALKARGHAVRLAEQTSGLNGIARVRVDGEWMWQGAADPRREGVARGD